MAYRVKEIFYTLQGEGAQAGRPAVFCRFSGCNLWSGRPEDRATAKCRFCDTDFVGADAGVFATAEELAQTIAATFPVLDPKAYGGRKPYIVFTGGEPALQLTRELISYNPGLILNVQSILSRLKQGKTTEDIPAILQGIFRPSVQPYLISWMQYDPREVIRQVKQPVLIVNGDNDIQISADNAEALAQARPDADKVIIEGMTHLLKQSEVTDPQRQKRLFIWMLPRLFPKS